MEEDIIRRDLETTKQESKESFSTFITKWRAKVAQMMSRPSEEEQLAMVVMNLLPIYHKYLFAQYFPNFKALILIKKIMSLKLHMKCLFCCHIMG